MSTLLNSKQLQISIDIVKSLKLINPDLNSFSIFKDRVNDLFTFSNLSEKSQKEIIDFIGEYEIVLRESLKSGKECTTTFIVHFKKYNLYLKEILNGKCHNNDIMIDGMPYKSMYSIVKPKEISIIQYNEIQLI